MDSGQKLYRTCNVCLRANCKRDLEFGASNHKSVKISALLWNETSNKKSTSPMTHSALTCEIAAVPEIRKSLKIQYLGRKMEAHFPWLELGTCGFFVTWFNTPRNSSFNRIFGNWPKFEISVQICSPEFRSTRLRMDWDMADMPGTIRWNRCWKIKWMQFVTKTLLWHLGLIPWPASFTSDNDYQSSSVAVFEWLFEISLLHWRVSGIDR